MTAVVPVKASRGIIGGDIEQFQARFRRQNGELLMMDSGGSRGEKSVIGRTIEC